MKGRRFYFLLLAACCCMTLGAQTPRVVVAYVTSWSNGLPDPTRMTHINYAFGGVGQDRKSVTISNVQRLQQIVNLKKREPELKVLLSIGGWGAGGFSEMSSDQTLRIAFCQAARETCDRYGLDGIDIDWEFPGSTAGGLIGASPNDKANYTLLMRDLRATLGDNLLLTMASNYEPSPYNFRDCIAYLDFVNVMCYNMASPPNHHAALYKGYGPVSGGYYSAQMAMNAHLNAGIPREKLVMGMPLYGHETNHGEQSYQRAKNLLASGDYVEDWDDKGKVPWIKKKSDGSFYMDFDNVRSIELKCRYIAEQQFKGGMYWDYYSDDNAGTLRNTIWRMLLKGGQGADSVTIDGKELTLAYAERFQRQMDMQQGGEYSIEVKGPRSDEAAKMTVDEDFFEPTGDGRFRFLPMSGKFNICVDLALMHLSAEPIDANGMPAALQEDGSGTIWVVGSKGLGKPTFAAAGRDWDSDDAAWPMAKVGARKFQFTVRIGEQLDANDVNFGFFLQKRTGDSFTSSGTYKILSSSNIFGIGNGTDGHNDGNVYVKSGQTLEMGSTYRFTLSYVGKINQMTMRVEEVATSVETIKREAENVKNGTLYDLSGRPVEKARKGIFVKDGKKKLIF